MSSSKETFSSSDPRKSLTAQWLYVIEHVDKQDGNKLIDNMEASADKVIIFTPNGYLAQDKELVKRNPWQEHLSGWSVADFKKRGYKVYGVNGLKILRGERANIVWKPRIFWFIISELSQWIAVFFPRLAFQLLAVKKR